MESKLKEMFPSGQWGLGNKAWMVKDGQYFWSVADIIDEEIVLTEFGKKLVAPVMGPPEVVSEVSINEELDAILNAPAKLKKSKAPFG